MSIAQFLNLCLFCFSPQRYPTDKAYFIAKEILTTERTYLKDLEVITVVSLFEKQILYTNEICMWDILCRNMIHSSLLSTVTVQHSTPAEQSTKLLQAVLFCDMKISDFHSVRRKSHG